MLGLVLSVFAALCFGLSTAFQKGRMARLRGFSFSKLAADRLWLASTMLGLIGIIPYVFALKYEYISIVQPMLSISIVTSVAAGRILFGERIGNRAVFICLIITGVLMLSL